MGRGTLPAPARIAAAAMFFGGLLAGSSVAPASVQVEPARFLVPGITVETLDQGGIETDSGRGRYPIQIDINPEDPTRGWVLFVKAGQPAFSPESAGKPCTDLRWKLDQEDEKAYRPLREDGTIVLENAAGGRARIALDLRIDLDWRTDPGTYDLGMVFTIVYR